MTKPTKVLHVGKSSRAHVLAETILRSRWPVENHMLCEAGNPGLEAVSKSIVVGPCADPDFVAEYARKVRPDFCIPGPEETLAAGVVDRLLEMGIPSVGPVKELARLEASKSFARSLLGEFDIPGNPDYRVFDGEDGLLAYLRDLGDFVVKPDGLSGGKGVRVSGDHMRSAEDGLAYCRELFAAGGRVVVEEKLLGEEFTLQSFCDGRSVAHTIPVQDHKRRSAGDEGPNTGGMGSYSCEDHLLPFLAPEDLALAGQINERVANALRLKTGKSYKGILYGSYIITASGLKVIEYNVRFGDPEVMNVLSLLETDFVDVCRAIINGTLHELPVSFARKATVCKYVVPDGYPEDPVRNVAIELPAIDNRKDDLKMYYGAVETGPNGDLLLTGSRAVAFVGIADTLSQAEQRAEEGAASVVGPVSHRHDIGRATLIRSRIEHMRALRGEVTEATARQFA
jgi:phosphoribosylamine--glycine ligase